jgi:cyclophilin family peptidyl-prolyl cis-trans isomerase
MSKRNDMKSKKERFMKATNVRKREQKMEESKSSNAMIYWLAGAFLLVVVFVGYFVWQASSNNKEVEPMQQTEQSRETEQTKQTEQTKKDKPSNQTNQNKPETTEKKPALPISDKPNPVKKIKNGLPTYASAPPLKIDTSADYVAKLKTSKGDMEIELYAEEAPQTVNNFIFLARDNFYDGVKFHRIMKDFMVQTGDPQGTGMGGPGYKFNDEFSLKYDYEVGTLAMANSGPNTNGSQFFIVTDTGPNLNVVKETRAYTIFGKVIKGLDTLTKIEETPVKASASGEASVPTEDVIVKDIEIIEKE